MCAKRCAPNKEGGARYQEFAREVDRVVGKIAQEIRSIDFSLQTRNRLVDYLKNLDRQFSALEQDVRRARTAYEKESNKELRDLQKRRIELVRLGGLHLIGSLVILIASSIMEGGYLE